ncbi:hypothetical protein RCH33_560 [Flavobacterium daejeonense]|nr:hypothetical protein RCH33_560 [Flavobacterium daejeonense]
MDTNKQTLKKLPKGMKFSIIDSYDEEDIILVKTIATLIYNGYSTKEIYNSVLDTENREDVRFFGGIVEDILLDFIKRNPEFAEILKSNNLPILNFKT